MRAEGAPHLVVYRAQERARTGSEGGNKGQRGASHASCRVSCAQRLFCKPTHGTCGLCMQVRNHANGAGDVKLGNQRARQASKKTRTVYPDVSEER